MPSGKKSKQMRRAAAAAAPPVQSKGAQRRRQASRAAPPPVQSKGAPRRRQASPRVLAISGGVAALVVVGIVLAVVLSGGKKSVTVPQVGSLANALPGASDVNGLLKGIPQHGLQLGWPSAKVTLVEYIDLQCPFCQQFETQVFPNIVQKYIATKKVKVEARVLDFIGPDSSRGRDAMIAAATQNKAFNFAQILYDNQGTENTGWLNNDMVIQAASSIPGLRVPQVLAEAKSSSVAGLAKKFDQQAAGDTVTGTPTLFVGKSGTKGKQVNMSSPTDQAGLEYALDRALSS
jgi:protein-disulfide isomerase